MTSSRLERKTRVTLSSRAGNDRLGVLLDLAQYRYTRRKRLVVLTAPLGALRFRGAKMRGPEKTGARRRSLMRRKTASPAELPEGAAIILFSGLHPGTCAAVRCDLHRRLTSSPPSSARSMRSPTGCAARDADLATLWHDACSGVGSN